jgi:hypothetical protein
MHLYLSKVNKATSGLYLLLELIFYVYFSCLVYALPAKPPAITHKKPTCVSGNDPELNSTSWLAE